MKNLNFSEYVELFQIPSFSSSFLMFSNKMLVIRAGIHKMLVRIANRKDPIEQQSDLGLCCLSRPFGEQLVCQILEYIYSTLHC